MTQAQYNEAINLIGHLILTRGDALTKLLRHHGIGFLNTPSRNQLIEATIDLLSEGNHAFTKALTTLIEQHIDLKGDVLLSLRKAGFDSYSDEDDFFGGLIKGAIGAIGGLLKKKKKRKSSSSNSSGSSSNAAHLQALQAKRDLERQIQQMREAQRQRDEALRRQREAERQRQEQAAKARRRNQTLMLVGGGVLVLGVVAFVFLKPTGRTLQPSYHNPKP